MASMSAAMQQLQQHNLELEQRVAVSEEKCKGVEARLQVVESTNTELCQHNTELLHRLDATDGRCEKVCRENADLKVQLDEHVVKVICSRSLNYHNSLFVCSISAVHDVIVVYFMTQYMRKFRHAMGP
jgi:Fe-S cluster assembly iron-binding protein IscA